MLFFIEAKVVARVQGISGPWEKVTGYLVDAPNFTEAKKKFENRVRMDHSHMEPSSLGFDYQKVYPQI